MPAPRRPTTTQDDLATINFYGRPNRPDEAGGTAATAASDLPDGTAYITSRSDVDVYSLGLGTGPVAFTADPVAVSPNLDIELSLLDAAGQPVASDDPVSVGTGRDSASGSRRA